MAGSDRDRCFGAPQVAAEHGCGARPTIGESPDIDLEYWLESVNDLADWAVERLGEEADLGTSDSRFFGLASVIEDRLGRDVMIESLGQYGILGISLTRSPQRS